MKKRKKAKKLTKRKSNYFIRKVVMNFNLKRLITMRATLKQKYTIIVNHLKCIIATFATDNMPCMYIGGFNAF